MFGEDESESPRVPSPWDSLISTPASASPRARPVVSSSPLAAPTIPKLVPEADDGNVEYKLQLLNPSPARFARLVTQLKWRLLEGGGQAYYELGVADSGALVGLEREDLERSLETLEMMAGEIGASVIVVKEIEVPAVMAEYAAAQEDYRHGRRRGELNGGSDDGTTTAAETENELSATDVDGDPDDTFFDTKPNSYETELLSVFTMDPEPDSADNTDDSVPQFSIDLEISSVFKPRPVRTRFTQSHLASPADGKRAHRSQKTKKVKHPGSADDGKAQVSDDQKGHGKSQSRRVARDKRREEKRKALLAVASKSIAAIASNEQQSKQEAESDALVSGLESLHVGHEEEPAPVLANQAIATDESIPSISLTVDTADDGPVDGEDDDVFASPTPSAPYKTFQSSVEPPTPLTEGTEGLLLGSDKDGGGKGVHLIVEALVVRKMSLEEAFLDFGGFSLT
ncbi:hypothetical protein V5O48_006261 [Marasmius crinis-equi]|uniref:GTP binding protein 2 n=1 Tax=Marasmius crinis-equi TaxID=585013 RepID=A0ABR3FJZ1_9AGAR